MDENSIACRMNHVENYADFEKNDDFINTNSILVHISQNPLNSMAT